MQDDEQAKLPLRQMVLLLQDVEDARLDFITGLLDLEHGDDGRRIDFRHSFLM